jgi:alkylation response protein AidB-like acyl-CoA dehydrogenase
MRFLLDAEQRLFAGTLRRMLAGAEVPKAVRAWSAGVHEPGRGIWSALAEAGVFAVAVPDSFGGAGPLPVELVTAAVELGRAGVPGPWVETFAAAELLAGLSEKSPATGGPVLREGPGDVGETLAAIAAGEVVVTLARAPHVPFALDADMADLRLVLSGPEVRVGVVSGEARRSLDPARRLFALEPSAVLAAGAEQAIGRACDLGTLACAAQAVGVGRALLEVAVGYAGTRRQYGRAIGEFQAVKHQLADAHVALEYAEPLVYGAALSHGTGDFARDASAAKVAAAEAAYAAARTALQVHGAIGYTDEYDPSLLIRKARALLTAWGTPSRHRARVLASL